MRSPLIRCDACDGLGVVIDPSCPHCDGEHVCTRCDGTGWICEVCRIAGCGCGMVDPPIPEARPS